MFIDIGQSSCGSWHLVRRGRRLISLRHSVKFVQTSCRISVPGISPKIEQKAPHNILRDKKAVPDADPPSVKDVNLLYQFFDQRLIYNLLSVLKFHLSSTLVVIVFPITTMICFLQILEFP